MNQIRGRGWTVRLKDVVLAGLETLEELSRQDFGDEAAEKWRDVRGLVNLWEGTMDELQKNLEEWP
jgi:hypothetical protein